VFNVLFVGYSLAKNNLNNAYQYNMILKKFSLIITRELFFCRSKLVNLSVGRVIFSVLSLEKLGQTFFAVIMTKTPLLMGFLVYELNSK
jgi:hypothetical protein